MKRQFLSLLCVSLVFVCSISNDEDIEHFLNGEKVSERLYRDAVMGQEQKPDAIWYDLMNEKLSSVLELITD